MSETAPQPTPAKEPTSLARPESKIKRLQELTDGKFLDPNNPGFDRSNWSSGQTDRLRPRLEKVTDGSKLNPNNL